MFGTNLLIRARVEELENTQGRVSRYLHDQFRPIGIDHVQRVGMSAAGGRSQTSLEKPNTSVQKMLMHSSEIMYSRS